MYYLIFDYLHEDIINKWKEAATVIEDKSYWTILLQSPTETEILEQINNISFQFVKDTNIYIKQFLLENEVVLYIRTIFQNKHSIWFDIMELNHIKWFLTKFPLMYDEIIKNEAMNNYETLYIPFSPSEVDNNYINSLYNMIHDSRVVPTHWIESNELFQTNKKITKRDGMFYWFEPQQCLFEIIHYLKYINSCPSLPELTDYLISKEEILNDKTTVYLNNPIFTLKNNNYEFKSHLNFNQQNLIGIFAWKAKEVFNFFSEEQKIPNFINYYLDKTETIGTVNLSNWRVIQQKWADSRNISSLTFFYANKLNNFFRPLRPIPYDINYDYEQYILFPFQEEFLHNFEMKASLTFRDNLWSYVQLSNPILKHRSIICNYLKESKCQIPFVYLLRTTNLMDFMFYNCWNRELNIFIPLLNGYESLIKPYIELMIQNNVMFELIWVWDNFSMPMMYEDIDEKIIEEWFDCVILNLNYVLNYMNRKTIWITFPKEGIDLFEKFTNYNSNLNYSFIFLENYPIRTNHNTFTKFQFNNIPIYLQSKFKHSVSYTSFEGFSNSRINLNTLSKVSYWRHEKRFDNFDLSVWNDWYDTLHNTINKIINQRPKFVTSWFRKPIGIQIWSYWVIPESLMESQYRRKLYAIALRLQKTQLMGVAFVKDKLGLIRQEAWRGNWWDVIDSLEEPDNFLGWMLNASLFQDISRKITWNEGFSILGHFYMKYNEYFPQWLPIENLE